MNPPPSNRTRRVVAWAAAALAFVATYVWYGAILVGDSEGVGLMLAAVVAAVAAWVGWLVVGLLQR